MEIKKQNIALLIGAGLGIYFLTKKDEKKTNADHIRTLTPGAKKTFIPFIAELTAKGLQPIIYSSKRSYLKQARLYAKDHRRGKPGQSRHNTGEALDIALKYKGSYLTSKTPLNVWIQSGAPQIAQKYGLKWGGGFKGYFDPNHFQMS
jgi:D-alanyl-D-alanine dipeptidase